MLIALESVDWLVWAYLALSVTLALALTVNHALARRKPSPKRPAPPSGCRWVPCQRCGEEFAQVQGTKHEPPRECWRCLS